MGGFTIPAPRLDRVATCVDAFDLDGECVVPGLPWADVSAFAVAEEGALSLTREAFEDAVGRPCPFGGGDVRYLEADGVLMAHGLADDVHVFYA